MVEVQIQSFVVGEPRNFEVLGKNMTPKAVWVINIQEARKKKDRSSAYMDLSCVVKSHSPMHVSQLNIRHPRRYNLGNLRVSTLLSP